ncbi:uncharacterized protein VNE69_10114 [Vairimorpha necatrix]|uniref:Uncharacterized protein n=1 Tax=Vairimorpha necatrix TaxID=6039 RepID=A0AAX4JFJ4_9MICR
MYILLLLSICVETTNESEKSKTNHEKSVNKKKKVLYYNEEKCRKYVDEYFDFLNKYNSEESKSSKNK